MTQHILPPDEFAGPERLEDGRPLVAVAMPAFNAARTLVAAVRSVLDQSYGNVQLVVCDDASTDTTAELLSAIADPRLLVLRNDSNLGQGPARDRAIASTSAPWIAVIDADDVWDLQRLERLMAANVETPDAMVFDDLLLCHDTATGMVPWKRLRGKDAFGCCSVQPRIVSLESFIVAPRLLIKPIFPAALVRQHGVRHSSRRFGEDIEYFLRLAALGARLRYVPEPLYRYRISPGSATSIAGAGSAMRDCIESCSKLEGISESEQRAFICKIRSLSDNEDLYQLARQVRSGRLTHALATLIRNPELLLLLTRRIVRVLGYETHRFLKSGSRRKSF